MSHRFTPVLLCLLALCAAAQPAVEISMPPNSQHTGEVRFANRCPTTETFQIAARPEVDWLRFSPKTVDVAADTSFAFHITVNTSGNRRLGTYKSNVVVICASCAATEPPCLERAKELPIRLTVGTVGKPGRFEPAPAGSATAAGSSGEASLLPPPSTTGGSRATARGGLLAAIFQRPGTLF